MRKVLLLIFIISTGVWQLSAQTCQPDPALSDTLVGVFPKPYEPTLNPEGGIKDTACVGFEYNFTFTAIIADSFNLGQFKMPLDSMWLDKKSAFSGLPAGLTYSCNPPNCLFKKNTKGCVLIHGVPAKSTEGEHKIKISGKLYANGSSMGLPLTFPDPNLAPGQYIINVGAANASPCRKLAVAEGRFHNLAIYPNPAGTNISISSPSAAQAQLYNQLGELLFSWNLGSGNNQFAIGHLYPGLYFVQVNTQNGMETLRFVKE
ncbi:T9SS type A sorting domain-containing protein [bacterium]|nr:T9SS type A sorting domain-containing protein [bacterium]